MIDTTKYKDQLLAEKKRLEEDLSGIATKKLNLAGEAWNAVPANREQEVEMRDEVADRFEDLTERASNERTFEGHLQDIDEALTRITDGRYGVCKVCGAEIEEDRLEANPAAATCKAHIEEK